MFNDRDSSLELPNLSRMCVYCWGFLEKEEEVMDPKLQLQPGET